MTEQFVEETLNKVANMYEDRYEAVTYFNTEEKELKELQEKEEVELPLFIFDTTQEIAENTLLVPVIGIIGKDIKEDFIKEVLIKFTPKRLKDCKIKKLKNADFTIKEEDEFTTVSYTLELTFI